jgi:hypothetical protein
MKGSFWWRDNLKLLGKYKDMAMVSVKKGYTCFLWQDNWFNLVPMTASPELLSHPEISNFRM